MTPPQFPRLADVRLDWHVLTFTAVATLLTGLLSGLLPAVRGARFDVASSLRGGSGATGEGVHGLRDRWLRDSLLVAEAAFTVVLIVGALLLIRSFVRLTTVDPGYTSEGVVTARVLMPPGGAPDRTDRFAGEVLTRLRGLPGVVSAGAGNMMPMLPLYALATFPLPDPSGASAEITARTAAYTVTPGYAEALGVRLRAGRFFDERDIESGTRSMIVNEPFARRYLGNGPVVGRQFSNLFRRTDKNVVTEIVGVVAPMLRDGNDREPDPEIYFVAGTLGNQRFFQGVNFVVRTKDEPRTLVAAVRAALRDTDRDVIIDRLQPLSDPLAESVAQPRFATATLVVFAMLALTLASVGLFGVLSYAVLRRGRELGVRAALGASRSSLLRLVLREGLAVTVLGVALGMAGAVAVTRLMQGALFGVTPLDPISFAIAPLVLLPVACAACLVPALRAARVGPADALRQ
jgi:predicted permease